MSDIVTLKCKANNSYVAIQTGSLNLVASRPQDFPSRLSRTDEPAVYDFVEHNNEAYILGDCPSCW